MAQRLIALAVLGEDPDSVPSTYMVFHNGLQLQFQGINAFSGPPLAHIWCTQTSSHNTHTHKIKVHRNICSPTQMFSTAPSCLS